MNNESLRVAYKTAKKIVIGSVGVTVLLIGVALLVLPGPAFIVIPTGLAILAIEFTWARRWLKVVRNRSEEIFHRHKKDNRGGVDGKPNRSEG